MKSTARLCLGLVTVSSFLAFTACGDDDAPPDGGAGQGNEGGSQSATAGTAGHSGAAKAGEGHGGSGHGDGAVLCEVVGTLCHDADTGSGMGHDCHQLGHVGNVETCAEQFTSCIGFCVGGETGQGGAGGGAAEEDDPYCAALGELCHPIEDGIGPECHELGHVGNAADCAVSFDECALFCLEARDALEEGAGGAGGAGAGGQGGSAGMGGGQ